MKQAAWCKKLALTAAMSSALCAQGAEYPVRPIRVIVTVPPGGAADFTARLVGQHLGEAFHQTIVIDNRPGASGMIATSLAAKATPDGYTLLQNSTTTHGIGPGLIPKLPYDPLGDFAPVIQINTIPLIMVVNRDVPASSVQELIALAKASPGRIKFASAGVGSAPHMAGELFKLVTGADLTHVPYKGSGPAVVDLASGQVQVMFDGAPSLLAQIKTGRLRPLAAASAKRNRLLPDLPTFAELGYKGVEAGLWYGVLAPAGTPKNVVRKLNTEINRILATPQVQERFAEQGAEVVGGTPERFGAFMRSEIARWGAVVKRAGIKAE